MKFSRSEIFYFQQCFFNLFIVVFTGFNQVVSLDLKFHGDSTYILWAVDEATKLIRGEVIHDKTPETMMKALDDIWITGRGLGPGIPERGFFFR